MYPLNEAHLQLGLHHGRGDELRRQAAAHRLARTVSAADRPERGLRARLARRRRRPVRAPAVS